MDTHPADPVAEAGRLQGIASDPAHSAFVSASAGSGKTKLLIDRLLRLMLPGDDRPATPPDRILCLTFTKAAAAEMAIRLRRKLGDWVARDDAALDRELAGLALPPTAATRDAARALFARVLDMPGGLRIGTIHAFCEQLLRRFPLEARISPHFRLVEDTDARSALGLAREAAFARAELDGAVGQVATLATSAKHAKLTDTLAEAADRLRGAAGLGAAGLGAAALASSLRAALGLDPGDEASLLARAVAGIDEARLGAALGLMETAGTEPNRKTASAFRVWLARDAAARVARWDEWVAAHVTKEGTPRSIVAAGKRFATAHPEVPEAFAAEAARVLAVEDARAGLDLVEATVALLTVAAPALADYAADKERLGLVDFADLIRRTSQLLDDPGVAWVLFKLDGGLDHLLLDEVQDTSSVQWRIAGKLTEEFFAGESAAESAGRAGRTVFAVGDFKQSIFSFQGADPEAFHRWRATFRDRARGAGAGFAEPELATSFRSSAPVLDFVDRVFAHPEAADGVAEADRDVPRHHSSRPHVPGRVEVWPLARAAPDDGADHEAPWTPARRNRTGITGPQRLADALARRIRRDIEAGVIRAGDVLVLVRRRGAFARLLVRALKGHDVPVAGLDRMVLTEQPAVVDLLAFCDAVLLPDDDLALATVLTSPLGATDDDGLMALALGRGARGLWDTLRLRAAERDGWARSLALLERLRARADWCSPHQFLVELLAVEGGRARLLARLGPEAGEAIDELLASSIAYAGSHIPSLGGFVHWLRRSGAEVKRETPESADEVRLMTVHGAKGLEGRLVIIADTTALPQDGGPIYWTDGPEELPVWVPNKAYRTGATRSLQERSRARALAEHNRLLYVALTRARDGLIVCGWAPARAAVDPRSWYAHCRLAIDTEGTEASRPLEDALFADRSCWDGEGRVLGGALAPAAAEAAVLRAPAPVPDRLRRPAPAPPDAAGRRTLAPSRPENAHLGPPPASSPRRLAASGAARAAARRRGDAIHALLQHLPALPPERRRPDGAAMAASLLPGTAPADRAALLDEALAVIAHPALASVFGTGGRPEQRVAGLVAGLVIDGVVDRMAIGPDAIDLVDFKSGRAAPDGPAGVPVFYLRQMAAYRAVLQALLPGRPVRCALVWTADASVLVLPPDTLDRHAPGVGAAPPRPGPARPDRSS